MSLTGEPPLTSSPSISSSSSERRGERSLFWPFVCLRIFFSFFFSAFFSFFVNLPFLTVSRCKLLVESGEARGESPSTNFLVPTPEGVTGEWPLEAVVGAEVSEGGAKIFPTTRVGERREGDPWDKGKEGDESVLGEGRRGERGERGDEGEGWRGGGRWSGERGGWTRGGR